MTVTEALELLSQTGVVVSEVNDIPGVKELPEIKPNLCTVEFPRGKTVHLPPSAIVGEGAPPTAYAPPPRYGEHTRAIMEELGIAAGEIDGLMDAGLIAGTASSDENPRR